MTREEAIKIIESNCSCSGSKLQEACAMFIPELRESEDERIRKWLIEEIKATHDYDSPTSRKCVDDAIAYLERQKEQKPAAWSEEDKEKLCAVISLMRSSRAVDPFYDKMCLEAWLKSLRPSWKPSEQEKGAIRTAIHILTEERNFPRAAAQLQNILNAFEDKKSRKNWEPSEE